MADKQIKEQKLYVDQDKEMQICVPKFVTRIKIGEEFTANVSRKFNCFQKKMIKFFFGWDVEDIDEKVQALQEVSVCQSVWILSDADR